MKKKILTFGVVAIIGCALTSFARIATNPPPGGIVLKAVHATKAAKKEVVAEKPSLVESNGPAMIDLGIGASSVVKQEIRLLDDGAMADYGLQKVHFPAEITEAPISITTPDGRKLFCRATFLALTDVESGQSLLIGEVRKSIGELVGDNTVTYPNAFDTISADIRYRYTKYSLEQDIIIHEAIKLPKEFQSENVRLEVWSEWIDSTPDKKESQTIDLRPLAAIGKQAAVPNTDERLAFGASRIADGYAFALQNESDRTPVAKTFATIEGRHWLIERVDYTAIKPKLDKLPKSQASLSPDQIKSDSIGLVKSLQARTASKSSSKMKRLAMARPINKDSLVLDFVIISSVPVPADCVSWWAAGGNTDDAIIASGSNGTMYNNSSYAPGKVGHGFSFDGSDGHVRIPDHPSLRFTDALTIEAWVNPFDVDAGQGQIVDKWDAVGGYDQRSYSLVLFAGGQCSFIVSPGGTDAGVTYVVSTTSVPINEWTHVAGTYDGETLKVYVNGVLEDEGDYSDGIFPGENDMAIGGAVGGASPGDVICPFPGMIDEPALYGRALSHSEILSLYNAGAAGKNNPNCTPPATNIVAWWSGDGNRYDLARTNHATVSGATYESAVVSRGFSFDGVNDAVTAANDNALNLATTNDNITIETWIKAEENSTDYGVMSVAGKRYSPNEWTATGYELYLLDGSPGFQIANSSGIASYTATGDLRDGGYHHVAVTMDRSLTNGGTIYVDGSPILTFNPTVVSGSLSNNAPIRIGVHPQPGLNCWYKGVIDEVTFYRRSLTGSEITALYTAGGAGKCKVDADADGLTDLQEDFLGTNPNDADSDDDGLTDGDEVFVHRTNPLNSDTDSDGVSDGVEILQGRNPLLGAVSDTSNLTNLKVHTPLK